MTRNGIEYKLELSPYKATVDGVTYIFSSVNHLDKFIEKLGENREIINYSLSKRFGFSVNLNILNDIVLYARIETRGFLIEYKGVYFSCKKDIILSGGTPTKKN